MSDILLTQGKHFFGCKVGSNFAFTLKNVKVTPDMPVQAPMEGELIASTHSQPGSIRRWVVSTMLRPFHSRERLHTYSEEPEGASGPV
jgi:hypothetical protein